MTSRARRQLAPAVTGLLLAMLGTLGTGSAHAIGCEELRASIAEKMQRGGLPRPAILILDAAERSSGRVVGTCDTGARKLVLSSAASPQDEAGRLPLQQAAAAQGRPARKPGRDEDMLVECFDGKHYTDGPCKR